MWPGGYPEIHHGDDVEEILKNETLPRRVIAAGLHAGLTVVLNVEKEEYYCSGAESIGWKVSHLLFWIFGSYTQSFSRLALLN